ncbi:periplasmic binding protein [Gloeomargarita lithophora Alchichica-D10]|uniref:Periplasmic binding protein n=1 Tax=Gloeomargarita lithophora Alchichica-D10 TaxID=1188229 RepID=A0A1J0AFX9_9CYAN|nr:ABC transporter substrate-binding protein [Gloeomargarita lithophora]APB34823.1 periplasmic binding protein [Gloeomargarita lithophora Alchichica-D10]
MKQAVTVAMLLAWVGAGCQTSPQGLKLGVLLPATGDLSPIGQGMIPAVSLLVEQVNACGGVNGQPVTVFQEDDQTQPTAGAAAMTKLVEVNRVGGVVGSFASSVSQAALDVAVRNRVPMVSPGSTSPEFTQRAKKGEYQGFWFRTAPPDTYQGAALAELARKRGLNRVGTVVINNSYGLGFEQEFIRALTQKGGQVVNRPTRYDPNASTLESEARSAFAGQPQAVMAAVYAETGALLLKSAYEQGLLPGVQVLLTDAVQSEEFVASVGKNQQGQSLISGAIGTVPGADGPALSALTKLWRSKQGSAPGPYMPQTWDAAAVIILAAQAAGSNQGVDIAPKIREISGSAGQPVSEVCAGLALIKEGKKINYQGASGNVDFDQYGDVVGSYDVWQVTPEGKIQVIDRVMP